MFGKLNLKQIDLLLARNLMGRLGCHNDGVTYVVPVSYAYDGEFIYSIAFEGMKLDIMRRNPKVCFEVDEVSNMVSWQSVIAWGDFEELTDPWEKSEALNLIRDSSLLLVSSITTHNLSHWPFISDDTRQISGTLFRIRIREKTGRFEHQHVFH